MVQVLALGALRLDVPILNQTAAVRILFRESSARRTAGVLAINPQWRMDENLFGYVVFVCNALVLAAGGPGELYRDSVYRRNCFGSLGLALEAGIEAVNLTESQFGASTSREGLPWNLSGTYVQCRPYVSSLDNAERGSSCPPKAKRRTLGSRPLAEIDDAPTHNAMNRGRRTALHRRRQRRPLRRVEDRRPARRSSVDEAARPLGVEPDHPIANDLQRHPGKLGRFRAGSPIIDGRQSQKTPRLRPALRSPRRSAQFHRVKIRPKRDPSHGEPPPFASLNHTERGFAIHKRARPFASWYKGSRPRSAG
jgi:hypothetical protein